ncbi:hypothetical protein ACO22_05860 [Paracoccidioides brasiliensis]|uniref:protein-tyrosine-phosphatase n=1 Tax=Paracoccidioides brasiliensis TaxID=121759 RepID=A0A1D2J941_PARBR|nr:hypothetical protein ACO22_05860 [Paracoccidioides brasiliensis]
MSATTATLPSPQAWSPGVGPNVSTTPMGLPQRTPSSVGQMTAPILGKPGTAALSPRLLRDSCNSYFGIVDFSTANPANSSSMHTRKAWNLPAGSSPVKLNCNTNNNNNNNSNNSNHCNRHSSEHTFEFEALRKQAESAGFIAGHRISSSFEKQTQAQRDRGRNAEEKRVRQSPISPHTTDASWTRPRYDDMMTSYMSIDPRPNTHTAEVKSATAFVKPIYDNIPTGPNSAANITCPVTPVSSEGGAQPMRLTLPQSAQNSFAMHRSRPLQRSETSPASVDQGNVIFISPSMCAELLKSSPGNTLFLDVRPYPQFTEARIKGALNLCIPTTLLKRPSFNLQKLQDTFAGEEKEGFARWQISTRIVVYDESTTHMKDASTLINVLKKFTSEGWKGEPSILRGGFAKFSAEFPEAVESASQINGGHQQPPSTALTLQRSISLALPRNLYMSIAGGCSIPKTTSTTHPFFSNIRQNTDLIDGVGQIPIKVPPQLQPQLQPKSSNRKADHLNLLPQWLNRASDIEDKGKLVSQRFLQIEQAEQKRMQEALTGSVEYGEANTSNSAKKPFRIAGIEQGSKNRYNNIYPYDHSRVRLQGVPNGMCDYFNASFVQSSRSQKRYIATQAPIPGTFNDFWRVVWEQDIRVIVMLTAESEGPQVKCHPYWKAGDYGPLQVKACTEKRIPLTISPQSKQQHQRSPSAQLTTNNINTTNSDSVTPFVTIRHLTLAHTSFPFQPIREITQLQYAHWPDFGTPAEPAHLVRLIEEVNRVAETTNGDVGNEMMTLAPEPEKQRRILVHCSAGCGRTGTFCTVDSVVDMLKRQRMAALASKTSSTSASVMTSPTAMETSSAMSTNMVEGEIEDGEERGGGNDDWLCRDDIDLIAATVEDFRLQRLSMVQSLKQFVLCYESVLAWIALHEVELVNGCVDDEHQLCPGIDRTMTAPLLAPLTAPSMIPLARKGLGGEEEGSSRSYDE